MNVEDKFHASVHDYPGGCQVVALRLGREPTVFKNMINPQCDTNHLRVRDFVLGMELMEDHSALHALNAHFGYVATKLSDQPAAADVQGAVIDIWAKLGKLGAEVSAGMADGRIDRKEAAAIEAAMYEALRPILGLGATINAMVTKC